MRFRIFCTDPALCQACGLQIHLITKKYLKILHTKGTRYYQVIGHQNESYEIGDVVIMRKWRKSELQGGDGFTSKAALTDWENHTNLWRIDHLNKYGFMSLESCLLDGSITKMDGYSELPQVIQRYTRAVVKTAKANASPTDVIDQARQDGCDDRTIACLQAFQNNTDDLIAPMLPWSKDFDGKLFKRAKRSLSADEIKGHWWRSGDSDFQASDFVNFLKLDADTVNAALDLLEARMPGFNVHDKEVPQLEKLGVEFEAKAKIGSKRPSTSGEKPAKKQKVVRDYSSSDEDSGPSKLAPLSNKGKGRATDNDSSETDDLNKDVNIGTPDSAFHDFK
ncbi:hypothetical protein Rhopal_003074-T1 [Rhodotorula paludigena]|uniref:Uncharacterized protein n=1 Tax=Rhodotorula paludigena TaxID=86838 RepID=A0AAV5GBX6_9BASI|nr:hypothetical protein Rhopal_003074-T1 [Rhodotorula paludigena]